MAPEEKDGSRPRGLPAGSARSFPHARAAPGRAGTREYGGKGRARPGRAEGGRGGGRRAVLLFPFALLLPRLAPASLEGSPSRPAAGYL